MSMKIPHEGNMNFRNAFKILMEWNQKDTYPWMKRKTVNFLAPYLGYSLSTITTISHYYWAVETECSINFQRGGATIVLISAVLFGLVDWHKSDAALLSGGKVKKFEIFGTHFALPLIAIFGTLLWGYGDLLPWLKTNGC